MLRTPCTTSRKYTFRNPSYISWRFHAYICSWIPPMIYPLISSTPAQSARFACPSSQAVLAFLNCAQLLRGDPMAFLITRYTTAFYINSYSQLLITRTPRTPKTIDCIDRSEQRSDKTVCLDSAWTAWTARHENCLFINLTTQAPRPCPQTFQFACAAHGPKLRSI